MTILDRYIAKEFTKYFTMTIVSLVSLYLIIDFFEKIRGFISNQATVLQVISFFFFSAPMIIWQILPASVLFASLITFGSLSRANEIMAMKACGVSIHRTSLPVITIALQICFIAFLISEFITPYTNETADKIKYMEIEKRGTAGAFKQNQIWYRGKEGIYNFKTFDPQTNSLQGITIYYLDGNLNLRKRVDAERGEWKNGRWTFYHLIATTFPPDRFPELKAMSSKEADMPEEPENFKAAQKDPANMGYLELRRYIKEIQSGGYDAERYLVDLHGKLAFPLVNIIMAIIGILFSVQLESRGGKTQGLAAGIIIGLSYWIVFSFTISLGRAGGLPPLLAAWAANILFGLAASFLLLRVRT